MSGYSFPPTWVHHTIQAVICICIILDTLILTNIFLYPSMASFWHCWLFPFETFFEALLVLPSLPTGSCVPRIRHFPGRTNNQFINPNPPNIDTFPTPENKVAKK